MKTMIIDLERCIGCRNCQLACKDEHVGNDWSPIAKSQPEGHFWMSVTSSERGTTPKVVVDWMPTMCLHCDNAPCIPACPEGAIVKREDGIVLIDPSKCTGCGDCMEACPYDVIYKNDELEICQKCTMCAHLLDDGWEEPRCVTACPAEALKFVDDEELEALDLCTEILKPEENTQPRVLYVGLPKPFIAGEVYSPSENICLDGVTVSAILPSGEVAISTETDNFGDFWLKGIPSDVYQLSFEKDGYDSKKISDLKVEDAVNVGEVELNKAGK